ncbi:MAG: hypothetical protein OQK76_05520 [Gammaproteobacteria bacterium]|nr:hypothetical protein [Gammaproteobacteria bacterium]
MPEFIFIYKFMQAANNKVLINPMDLTVYKPVFAVSIFAPKLFFKLDYGTSLVQ